MKLTVYLFRDNFHSFEGLIHDRYLNGDSAYKPIEPICELPFECLALMQANKIKPPRWVEFIRECFDIESFGLENSSNSFVLLIKKNGRIFAFTFGYAYNAVDRSKIETGFGLRCTLNSIRTSSIDTLDTRNIDLVTKQSRIHLNIGSPIHEFEINTAIDWIRYASGKPEDQEFAKRIAGSDSVQISLDYKLSQLGEVADELFSLYSSTNYKERFPFVDSLAKIQKSFPKHDELNSILLDFMAERSTDKLTLAHPEIPHPDITHYKIFVGYSNVETQELDLDSIYSFLDQNEVDDPLHKVHIIGLDVNDAPRSPKRDLIDFLVCEIDQEQQKYVLSLGSWFQVAKDFITQVKQQVSAIPDVTDAMNLPPLQYGESEGHYNQRVSEDKNWLLLDKEDFIFDTYTEKIEACDLVTPQGQLVAVKKMHSSATLSHLFAQASVSAKLLKTHQGYADKLLEFINNQWAGLTFERDKLEFVYAIPTKKSGPISDCLFFFSIINLIDHVKRIQLSGFPLSLCKIEYE